MLPIFGVTLHYLIRWLTNVKITWAQPGKKLATAGLVDRLVTGLTLFLTQTEQ